MKTFLSTAHEEQNSDNSKSIGVLTNFTKEGDYFKDSLIYIYNKNIYIFFETIFDMLDYLLYAKSTTRRAYMRESDFDMLYDDKQGIKGKFNEHLNWVN